MDIPTVVIVGRANVGKSSLFNAIYGRRVAIVERTPGVTRDRISRVIEADAKSFELVDTGGIGLHDSVELAADVEAQILIAIEQADLVLFVVDVKAGLQPMEMDVSRRLRQAGKRVMLVANKCDTSADEAAAADFYALGVPRVRFTAAVHRKGVQQLLDDILAELPDPSAEPGRDAAAAGGPMKIAFVGRRNVGKSTLVNRLANEPRVIVSEIPGTTRDSVDVRFRMGEMEFVAIDTAGLRRRKQIKNSIDFYSAARAERSIRRADVVVHLLEAPMEIGRVDKQLGRMVAENYKPCVLGMNKMDLAGGVTDEDFRPYVRDRLPGVGYCPIVCISAETGENVAALIDTARVLHEQGFIRVPTSEMNRVVEDAVQRRPPPSMPGRFGRIYYATQVSVNPPTVALFTNEPSLIDTNYRRYLANRLRRAFGFDSIPIRFVVRGRKDRGAQEG